MKSSFSSNYYFNLLAINAEKNEKDFDDSKVENIQNQKWLTKDFFFLSYCEYFKKIYCSQEFDNSLKNFEIPDKTNIISHRDSNSNYFLKKKLTKDDSFRLLLSVYVYTCYVGGGDISEEMLQKRPFKSINYANNCEKFQQFFFPICHYLIKALSFIPCYWGKCIRAVNLRPQEFEKYQPGSIVQWVQASSCTKDFNLDQSYFKNRNTNFIIDSLTGRDIEKLSYCKTEKEVLFFPYSTFLVCKKYFVSGKIKIEMKEIILDYGENVILWVDEKIFDEAWKYRKIVNECTSQVFQKNITFIPKNNINSLSTFFKSRMGELFLEKKGKIFISLDCDFNSDKYNTLNKLRSQMGNLLPKIIIFFIKEKIENKNIGLINELLKSSDSFSFTENNYENIISYFLPKKISTISEENKIQWMKFLFQSSSQFFDTHDLTENETKKMKFFEEVSPTLLEKNDPQYIKDQIRKHYDLFSLSINY